jgi:hypothetical protein
MTFESENKTSAQLQREIEQQRHRVESTIDQIQEKLSPGQLVDELLAYTKGGSGEFVASLQRNITANPLPVALLGVSLAWLMAKPAAGTNQDDRYWDTNFNQGRRDTSRFNSEDEDDYPVTAISGLSLQRLGSSVDERGDTYSEFVDDAGKKFRALSDRAGKRAGHFTDEAGNRFRGFTNAAGERINEFRDETGNLLEEATGWASHTWQKAREKLSDTRDAIGAQASAGKDRAAQAGDAMRSQVGNLNRQILSQFRDQPLVGGALAFAVGAALGSTLPHTPQEDALMGEAADALKDKVGESAAELYDQGKEKAADIYAAASEKAGEIYQQAKDGVVDN